MARNAADLDRITFTCQETATALGVDVRTVRRWAKAGTIPAVVIGGRVLVLSQHLVDQIEQAAGRVDAETADFHAEEAENAVASLAAEQASRRASNDPTSSEYIARAAAHAIVEAEMEAARASAPAVHGTHNASASQRPF